MGGPEYFVVYTLLSCQYSITSVEIRTIFIAYLVVSEVYPCFSIICTLMLYGQGCVTPSLCCLLVLVINCGMIPQSFS